jgi:hypothetical protein
MSFILQPSGATVEPIDAPVDLYTALTYSYVAGGGAYTWQCTNLDSFTTYTVSTTNGTVTFSSAGVLSYSPATVGIGGFTINDRLVALTIGAPVGYFELLNDPSITIIPTGGAIDSSSNLYSVGTNGAQAVVLQKTDINGVLQWQIKLTPTNQASGVAVAVDSSNNIYVGGSGNTISAYRDFLVAKYNSSGVLQWQRALGNVATFDDRGEGIAVDSSANVGITGYENSSGVAYAFLTAKYNTSGTIQWQRRLSGSYACFGKACAFDTSGNLFVAGRMETGSGIANYIAKYDTSGTLQWQRQLKLAAGYGSSDDYWYGITIDSAGNPCVTGRVLNGGYTIVTAKYNTSGALQWQRSLSSGEGRAIATDSSDNVYICGYSGTSVQIAKYNSSGTLQYQRSLTTSVGITGVSISISGTSMYISALILTTAQGTLNFRLPTDGSSTSTYTIGAYSLVYAASALTSTTTTYVDSAGSLSGTTPSYTEVAGTLTAGTTTFTSTTTLF